LASFYEKAGSVNWAFGAWVDRHLGGRADSPDSRTFGRLLFALLVGRR